MGVVVVAPERRKELLAEAVLAQLRAGRRIESQGEYQAVIVYGQKVNHVLHFLLGLVTFGLWWLVWIMIAIAGGMRRELLVVDDQGAVSIQKMPRL